ncbi:MAG: FAD-dependent monooxygenase [Lachnospiraceae bacterium]
MDSIWMDGEQLPHFSSLEGSIKTDVLIIGGGMAGLLCALFLQEKGVDYTFPD